MMMLSDADSVGKEKGDDTFAMRGTIQMWGRAVVLSAACAVASPKRPEGGV